MIFLWNNIDSCKYSDSDVLTLLFVYICEKIVSTFLLECVILALSQLFNSPRKLMHIKNIKWQSIWWMLAFQDEFGLKKIWLSKFRAKIKEIIMSIPSLFCDPFSCPGIFINRLWRWFISVFLVFIHCFLFISLQVSNATNTSQLFMVL